MVPYKLSFLSRYALILRLSLTEKKEKFDFRLLLHAKLVNCSSH